MNTSGNFSNSAVAQNVSRIPWPFVDEPRAVTIIRIFVEVLVAFFGVCGNGIVCFTAARQRRVRSSIRYYIKSLAIADIGILLLNFPVAIVKEQLPYNWPFGKAFCLYVYPVLEIFHASSIWSIAAIALERYRYIAPSMRYARHSSKKIQRTIIATIWITSFVVVSFPLLFVMKFLEIPTLGRFCLIDWPTEMFQIYNAVMCVFWYLLPLSMIMLTYIQIAKQLRASLDFHNQMNGNVERARSESASPTLQSHGSCSGRMELNYKAKKILTPIVILFAVSMFPINLLRIMAAFWEEFPNNRYFLVVYNVSVLGVVVNSAADPLVYYFATKNFVKEIKTPCQQLTNKFRKLHCLKGSNDREFPIGSRDPMALCEILDSVAPRSK